MTNFLTSQPWKQLLAYTEYAEFCFDPGRLCANSTGSNIVERFVRASLDWNKRDEQRLGYLAGTVAGTCGSPRFRIVRKAPSPTSNAAAASTKPQVDRVYC